MSEDVDLKTPETGADPAPREAAETEAPTLGADQEDTQPEARESGSSLLGEGEERSVPADWPSDWRAKLSNGDEKLLKRLERFTDPSKIFQSWLAAEQKISSGEDKKGLDENATEEQVAEWRAANGIPDAADGYKPTELDGLEWSESDQPLLNTLFEAMHGANATQAQVDAALSAYGKLVSETQVARQQADRAFIAENEDALRAKYGDQFRPNLAVYKRVLEQSDNSPLPRDVVQALMTARDENGNAVINNAAVADFIVQMGLDYYGPAGMETGDGKATAQTQLDEIKQIMKTDIDKYYREGWDKKYSAILERQMGKNNSGPRYYDP